MLDTIKTILGMCFSFINDSRTKLLQTYPWVLDACLICSFGIAGSVFGLLVSITAILFSTILVTAFYRASEIIKIVSQKINSLKSIKTSTKGFLALSSCLIIIAQPLILNAVVAGVGCFCTAVLISESIALNFLSQKIQKSCDTVSQGQYQRFAASLKNIRVFKLGDISYDFQDENAMRHLGEAIKKTSIELIICDLNISNLKALAAMIESLIYCTVTKLDLSGLCKFYPAYNSQHFEQLGRAIKNSSITKVYFHGHGRHSHGADTLSNEALLAFVRGAKNSGLLKLHLVDNMFKLKQSTIIQVLKKLPNLISLNLSFNSFAWERSGDRIYPISIASFARELKNTSLRKMTLIANSFKDEHLTELAAELPHSKITKINLQKDDRITIAGAQALSACVNNSMLLNVKLDFHYPPLAHALKLNFGKLVMMPRYVAFFNLLRNFCASIHDSFTVEANKASDLKTSEEQIRYVAGILIDLPIEIGEKIVNFLPLMKTNTTRECFDQVTKKMSIAPPEVVARAAP